MTRTVYVNGRYCDYGEAAVHAEDRGFLFADGVYEVCEVKGGCIVDERLHMARLARSMRELDMDPPMSESGLGVVMRETIRRNRVRDGIVYVQVTRGTARRDFYFPERQTPRTLMCFARQVSLASRDTKALKGLRIKTMPDIRWSRPDIKSISLLPNVLAKQTAKNAGADDAWLVDRDGFVTEGASNNAWIVTHDGEVVTRPAHSGILRGITREVLLAALARSSYRLKERPFTVSEAKSAKEAFVTSASALVMPVIEIDGCQIANGKPGPITMELRRIFYDHAEISSRHRLLQQSDAEN